MLNRLEIIGSTEEQEGLMLSLAGGQLSREELVEWLQQHVMPVGRGAE